MELIYATLVLVWAFCAGYAMSWSALQNDQKQFLIIPSMLMMVAMAVFVPLFAESAHEYWHASYDAFFLLLMLAASFSAALGVTWAYANKFYPKKKKERS